MKATATCQHCGKEFSYERRNTTGRPRKNCPQCRSGLRSPPINKSVEALPTSQKAAAARKTVLCQRCGKDLQEYLRAPAWFRKYCPECASEVRYEKGTNEHETLKRSLKWTGLTTYEYEALAAAGCASCGTHEPGTRDRSSWGKDHDHSCQFCGGEKGCPQCFRGLLCTRCNTALGMFDDDIEQMHKAVKYLEDWEKRKPRK